MASKRPTFYIIDGHAHIYRAYFAPFRDLTSPTGEPTKATYVFTQMLMQLVEMKKPDYLAMVIDSGDETVFRKAIDPNYKANREPPPADFKPQEQRILQIVKDAGVPIICRPGFEADDIIASLVEAHCDEFEIFMVSKDKDLRQLVGSHCYLYDVTRDETFDADHMRQKLGYGPEQAVDVQTLMGDNIDNVPGVPGIGEKTAAKLINKYGSAAAVLEHADELTPKQRENVKNHGLEKLDIARRLVTLKRDLPVHDIDLNECKFESLDTPNLRNHLDQLGFRSLLARVSGGEAPTVREAQKATPPQYSPLGGDLFSQEDAGSSENCQYTLVDTPEKLADFITELRKQRLFAVDTETDGLGARGSNLVGLSFSWTDRCGHYLPVKGPMGDTVLDVQQAIDAVKPVLEDPNVGKIGQNIKYDQLVLRGLGIDLRGVVADTMLMAFVLDAGRNSYKMDSLAADLLGHATIPIKALIGTGKKQITMDQVPVKEVAVYAAEDADVTWRLYRTLEERLKAFPTLRQLHDEIEVPLISVLAEMEWNGVRVDPRILKEQSQKMAVRIEALRHEIEEQAGGAFNPDSPKQLQEILFDRLGLKPIKKIKTGFSTDAATLDQLAGQHPLPGMILEYRGLMKLRETYLENLAREINPRTDRIHTSFNQTGASTGRLSSSDPNLQNIPIRTEEGRAIRTAFVADKGNVLLTADYSQIELRFLAQFTQEERLTEAFREDQDIHRAVAADVYKVPLEEVTDAQRRNAKMINFAIIYGVSAFGLARRIEELSQRQAQTLIDAYKANYPRVFQFFEQCIQDAKGQGYVQTIRGRRRPIPEIESRIASMRQYAERTAINSVIQGSAADLIKIAMNNVHRRMQTERVDARLLLQVHDELVFECPEGQAELVADLARVEMVNAMELSVPLKVDTGWARNWREAK